MSAPETLASNLFSVFLRMHRLMNRRMAEQGASLARTKLLLFLAKRGPARAADIADFFDNAPRTVTEAIDGLERDGLVVRTPDARDRRVKQVSITDAGRRVTGETEPMRRALIDAVFGVLSSAEQAQLDDMLARMLAAVEAQEAHERREKRGGPTADCQRPILRSVEDDDSDDDERGEPPVEDVHPPCRLTDAAKGTERRTGVRIVLVHRRSDFQRGWRLRLAVRLAP